ncbi:right-handed parallel beta-helix repeat-containing protein [Undibacterium terreum]|uniref:Right handed beta helix region n=1 Tax=Undibacterium terreum TaxID=1224302 RepID=A0A916UT18_9BURK|nr:right-handed parallel beta-helix repeat-containing protein [Undibacterium terreum]GGC87021.1 hypothetical protein GCM10011396_37910 [Undibacterium terreum]
MSPVKLVVALIISLYLFSAPFARACINGGTEVDINNALRATNIAELCQGAQFTLNNAVLLNSNNSLFTTGYPTNDSLKANLKLADNRPMPSPPTTPFALVDAYGNNISIKSIKIDGNKANNAYYGPSPLLGVRGSINTVDHVRLEHTIGFVALDAADDPNCSYLTLTNNYVGSNGIHLPAAGGQWADGITIRCSNAYVANNEVRDATDGGISFFGGTNTIIENNWIANSSQSAYSAIIVDPVMGGTTPVDFTGSYVRNNTIQTCCGQHFHVALSVGTHLWCNVTNGNCNYAMGPSVTNNTGSGTFGYGIYLGGATSATVTGNNLTMTPFTGLRCGWQYYALDVDSTTGAPHATGNFQSGYVTGSYHWPCVSSATE